MRVLGLDPAADDRLWRCGEARQPLPLRHARLRRAPARAALPQRLHHIAAAIGEVMDRLVPDCVVVEEAFFRENVHSAMVVSHVRGALIRRRGPARPGDRRVQPARDQAQRDRNGGAAKEQVEFMVRRLLG